VTWHRQAPTKKIEYCIIKQLLFDHEVI